MAEVYKERFSELLLSGVLLKHKLAKQSLFVPNDLSSHFPKSWFPRLGKSSSRSAESKRLSLPLKVTSLSSWLLQTEPLHPHYQGEGRAASSKPS